MTCFSSFFAKLQQKMKKNLSSKFTDELSVTFQSSVSGPGEFGLRMLFDFTSHQWQTEPNRKYQNFGIISSVKFGNIAPKLLEVVEQIGRPLFLSTFKSSYWEAFSKLFEHFFLANFQIFKKNTKFSIFSIFYNPECQKFHLVSTYQL